MDFRLEEGDKGDLTNISKNPSHFPKNLPEKTFSGRGAECPPEDDISIGAPQT